MLTGIIDVHTHLFPPDVIKNQEKYCRLDSCFGVLADPKCTIQRYATAEETIALADEAGIKKVIMQGWYWRDHGLCEYHNDYMYDVIRKYPYRFEAFASINPRVGWPAIWEMEKCYQRGFIGIGEMGPGGQGWDLNDKDFLHLMEAAVKCNMLVNIHAGEPVGRIYAGKDPTPFEGFYDLAKKFPELKLILAHWGGGLPYYEMWHGVKETMKNVYYDTAGNPLLYKTRVFECVAKIVGTKKILYGSDFPLLLYPRKEKHPNFKSFINDIIENGGLNEEELQDVFYKNTQNLIDSIK